MSDSSNAAAPSAGEPQNTAPPKSSASPWVEPTFPREQTGMGCFLLSEGVFFSTLIITYVRYIGESQTGPTPREALSLPLIIGTSICLLSSSLTIVIALRGLTHGRLRQFYALLGVTFLLGALFLAGTAYEWTDLILNKRLWPGTNLFGSTFYTLVGFHALHVTLGLMAMLIMAALVMRGWVSSKNPLAFEMTSWYWHLVDGVWVIIFSVVYLFGR